MIAVALILWVVLAAVFAAAYLFARRIDNYGLVDIVWSYAFMGSAAIYITLFEAWRGPALIFLAMIALWSGRLGTHLLFRVRCAHPAEDRRYGDLRRDWRDDFGRRMVLFFQAQAASVVILSLPFLLVFRDPPETIGLAGLAGLVFWGGGLFGEAVADRQLRLFKKSRGDQAGSVCQEGLWRYSRHPNYFFEWLMWVGFALFALQSAWGFLGFLSPVIIYFLLTRVSGIPPTESAALRSRGEAYRHYQRTTSPFFPWPPRSA